MFNKSTIVGRLGQDPDVRFTADGKPIANLSVVTSEFYKDKTSGERKERTEWHRVVLFGSLADIAQKYLKKGGLVLIEGPLRTRKWQDQSGHDRYTTEIHAQVLKMLSSKNSGSDSDHQSSSNQAPSQSSSSLPSEYPNYSDADFNSDDEIPF